MRKITLVSTGNSRQEVTETIHLVEKKKFLFIWKDLKISFSNQATPTTILKTKQQL